MSLRLPSFSHFKNQNGWIGSIGLLRFQIEPPTEEDTMTVVLWQGPFSRPYAQELERQTFPVTPEGRQSVIDYLEAAGQRVADAPPFSPQETTAYYEAKKAEEATAQAAE